VSGEQSDNSRSLFDSDVATRQCAMRRNIDDIDDLIIKNMTGIENTQLRNS